MDLGSLLGIETPELGRQQEFLRRAVRVVEFQGDGGDDAADIRNLEDVEVMFGLQQLRVDLGFLELLEEGVVFLFIAGQHGGLVVAVVEIL